jgi:hypothetical protein
MKDCQASEKASTPQEEHPAFQKPVMGLDFFPIWPFRAGLADHFEFGFALLRLSKHVGNCLKLELFRFI